MPFKGTAHNHFLAEIFPIEFHQMNIVGNYHDGIARGGTGDGAEADKNRDGNLADK